MIPCTVGMIDPERERHRLREEYSRMMDGELEQIAEAATDLTDLAKWAIREEMSRRGLPLDPHREDAETAVHFGTTAAMAPVAQVRHAEIKGGGSCVVRRLSTFPEALIARSCLESAGIRCSIADEYVLGASPYLSNALGGVRLFVDEANLNEVTKILDEAAPYEIEVQGVGKYVQPRCPQCYSLDITFGELSNAGKLSLPLGLPLPPLQDEWKCHNCGCHWTDSDEG